MGKRKVKYYVVWVGQKPGVYNSWDECQAQIMGYPGARYKSFLTKDEALKAYKSGPGPTVKSKKSKLKSTRGIEKNSISVDAACSQNPGIMEYRGVITSTGEELFRMGPYYDGTNNVGEFLALVQALAYLKKLNKPKIKIYSDSRTAMSWVRNKKVKTTLQRTTRNKDIFFLIEKALKWLDNNSYANEILKWDTKNWGEIPADFGRK